MTPSMTSFTTCSGVKEKSSKIIWRQVYLPPKGTNERS